MYGSKKHSGRNAVFRLREYMRIDDHEIASISYVKHRVPMDKKPCVNDGHVLNPLLFSTTS